MTDPYLEYLARFDSEVGALPVGGYGKWRGRLVRKLGPDEFTAKWGEFSQLDKHYEAIMERGDTLNDAVLKVLRERQADLLLDNKTYTL